MCYFNSADVIFNESRRFNFNKIQLANPAILACLLRLVIQLCAVADFKGSIWLVHYLNILFVYSLTSIFPTFRKALILKTQMVLVYHH